MARKRNNRSTVARRKKKNEQQTNDNQTTPKSNETPILSDNDENNDNKHTHNMKKKKKTHEEKQLLRMKRLRQVLWRDFLFLVLGGVALRLVGYIEEHAADVDIRGGIAEIQTRQLSSNNSTSSASSSNIVDAGFILTSPLYKILAANRNLNDLLAFLNSLMLLIPTIYTTKVTLWYGDYSLPFRLLATQLFRSFCGWFTFLPPDPSFLMSYYDFPEVVHCLKQDCTTPITVAQQEQQEVLPFVSFFSGHVAMCVIVANHMYIHKCYKSSVLLHILNALQIIRLLATRGHYSIDIIIGWCVAIYISNSAGRLGLYYSKGIKLKDLLVPDNAVDAFERTIGIHYQNEYDAGRDYHPRHHKTNNRSRKKKNKDPNPKIYLTTDIDFDDDNLIYSDTTARIAAEMASEFAKKTMNDVQNELSSLGLQLNEYKELSKNDLLRVLSMAKLKMNELREEAKWFDIDVEKDEEEKLDVILKKIIQKMKDRVNMNKELAKQSIYELQMELNKMVGIQMKELKGFNRIDMIRLINLAELKIGELRTEARMVGVKITEEMNKRDILESIMENWKLIVQKASRLRHKISSTSSSSSLPSESSSSTDDDSKAEETNDSSSSEE